MLMMVLKCVTSSLAFGNDLRIKGTNLDVISKVIFVAKYFGAKRTRSIGRPSVHDQHVFLHVALISRTFSTKVALILEEPIPKLHGSQKDHDFLLINHGDSIWKINSSKISANHHHEFWPRILKKNRLFLPNFEKSSFLGENFEKSSILAKF